MLFCHAFLKEIEEFEILDDLTYGDRIIDSLEYSTQEDFEFMDIPHFLSIKETDLDKNKKIKAFSDNLLFISLALIINPYVFTQGIELKKTTERFIISFLFYLLMYCGVYIISIIAISVIIRSFWAASKSTFYSFLAIYILFYTINLIIIQIFNLNKFYLDMLIPENYLEKATTNGNKMFIALKTKNYFLQSYVGGHNNEPKIKFLTNHCYFYQIVHICQYVYNQESEYISSSQAEQNFIYANEGTCQENIEFVSNILNSYKDNQQIPKSIKQYITESQLQNSAWAALNSKQYQDFILPIELFFTNTEKINYLLSLSDNEIKVDNSLQLFLLSENILGESITDILAIKTKNENFNNKLTTNIEIIKQLKRQSIGKYFALLISQFNIIWDRKLVLLTFTLSIIFGLILMFYGNNILNINKKYTVYISFISILVVIFLLCVLSKSIIRKIK